MNKNIYFLSGIFRCGNTLLRSILNQNPNLHVTPNSIIPEIAWFLHKLKETKSYKDWLNVDVDNDYPDNEKYYNNIIKNLFNNYYSQYKENHIIEQGRWGTPANFELLKKYNFLPSKFIILVRPFEEILKSWLRVYETPTNEIEKVCDELMTVNGSMGQSILALEYLTKYQKDNLLLIKYDDLCSNTEKEIKKIYKFLDIPFFKNHKFTNLKQVDGRLSKHTTIRTNKVEKKNYENKIKLPKNILFKYKKEIDLLYNISMKKI